MSRASLCLVLLAACGGAPPEAPIAAEPPAAEVEEASWSRFGADVSEPESVLAASELLADPASKVGSSVAVDGRVADVCQAAGCWMVLTDGDKLMRIRMKGHAFSVAKDSEGKSTRVFGTVVKVGVDKNVVDHFKSESKSPDAMPEAQLPEGTKETYELIADAVWVRS